MTAMVPARGNCVLACLSMGPAALLELFQEPLAAPFPRLKGAPFAGLLSPLEPWRNKRINNLHGLSGCLFRSILREQLNLQGITNAEKNLQGRTLFPFFNLIHKRLSNSNLFGQLILAPTQFLSSFSNYFPIIFHHISPAPIIAHSYAPENTKLSAIDCHATE